MFSSSFILPFIRDCADDVNIKIIIIIIMTTRLAGPCDRTHVHTYACTEIHDKITVYTSKSLQQHFWIRNDNPPRKLVFFVTQQQQKQESRILGVRMIND